MNKVIPVSDLAGSYLRPRQAGHGHRALVLVTRGMAERANYIRGGQDRGKSQLQRRPAGRSQQMTQKQDCDGCCGDSEKPRGTQNRIRLVTSRR